MTFDVNQIGMEESMIAAVRTFIALPLDPAARGAALRIQDAWRREWPCGAVAWVPERNFHLTLRFLGEIAEPLVAPVGDVLAAVAAASPPIALALDRPAAFPDNARPSVLVIEAKLPADLLSLVETLDARLKETGFGDRDRPFRVHLTLGRVKQRHSLGQLPPMDRDIRWTADRAVLYRSLAEPQGSRYVALREVLLGGCHR